MGVRTRRYWKIIPSSRYRLVLLKQNNCTTGKTKNTKSKLITNGLGDPASNTFLNKKYFYTVRIKFFEVFLIPFD